MASFRRLSQCGLLFLGLLVVLWNLGALFQGPRVEPCGPLGEENRNLRKELALQRKRIAILEKQIRQSWNDRPSDSASDDPNEITAPPVHASPWIRALDERGDPTVNFSLPVPPGDLRDYVPPIVKAILGKGIVSRGPEYHEIVAQEKRVASTEDCNSLLRFLGTESYKCKHLKRFGHELDGGWTVCLDRPLPPKERCVGYSFGLAFDWSFDEDLSQYCRMYGFDPTLRVKGTQKLRHDEKRVGDRDIDYYSMGLSGHGRFITNSGKPIPTMTLQAVMKVLGHDHIDVLKLDVEGSEWSVIHSMANWNDSPLDRVDQLLMEMHYTHLGFFYLRDAMQVLTDKGFMLFFIRKNTKCQIITLGNSDCRIKHCMEFGFIRNSSRSPLPP